MQHQAPTKPDATAKYACHVFCLHPAKTPDQDVWVGDLGTGLSPILQDVLLPMGLGMRILDWHSFRHVEDTGELDEVLAISYAGKRRKQYDRMHLGRCAGGCRAVCIVPAFRGLGVGAVGICTGVLGVYRVETRGLLMARSR